MVWLRGTENRLSHQFVLPMFFFVRLWSVVYRVYSLSHRTIQSQPNMRTWRTNYLTRVLRLDCLNLIAFHRSRALILHRISCSQFLKKNRVNREKTPRRLITLNYPSNIITHTVDKKTPEDQRLQDVLSWFFFILCFTQARSEEGISHSRHAVGDGESTLKVLVAQNHLGSSIKVIGRYGIQISDLTVVRRCGLFSIPLSGRIELGPLNNRSTFILILLVTELST